MEYTQSNLNLLARRIRKDTGLSEDTRSQYLARISDVKSKLKTGEYVESIEPKDRLTLIKEAAEKVQSNNNLKGKMKSKSKKVRRKVLEDSDSVKDLGTYDMSLMGSSDSENREVALEEGITDSYVNTVRFDEEWN